MSISVYIIKVYIIIREYNIINILKHLICNKPMRIMTDKHQQL